MAPYLTCWAEYSDGKWEAVCLDFNLAVQGKTVEEVDKRLVVAVEEYLDYVGSLPEEEQLKFLYRKSPIGLRFKVLIYLIMVLLFRPKDEDAQHDSSLQFPILDQLLREIPRFYKNH